MPFSRYQIRNEYSLADPELYKTADKDDPEALLEGVAMAGLVGVLRQLGDLAEFAAEIFHGLHEEVMVTAARGHGLLVRVQQLESDFPSVERAFLSQTGHSAFFSGSGVSWHPNLQTEQNLITRGDLPRFVMDSYEECRGPPRLFLLDKFDVAGAGSCLKRYTDPSFYKVEASSYELTSAETQRDKKIRKTKRRGSRLKNEGTPEVLQPSHVKLHQLLMEERMQTGVSEPARHVKLKKRQTKFPFDTEDGKGYMEKLLSSPSEDKLVHEVPFVSSPLRLPTNSSGESRLEILEGSMVNSSRKNTSLYESPSVDKTVEELPTLSNGLETEVEEKHISVDGYQSDDVASETDNYVDALTTMESENETDFELRANSDDQSIKQETHSDANIEQPDSQSASDGGSSSVMKKIASFSYSDTTSTSADSRAFACTEIPFHPRVSPNEALPVDQGPILKESSSRESDLNQMSLDNSVDLDSPRTKEENQTDPEAILASASKLTDVHSPTIDDPSSSSFVRDPEFVVDNEDRNSSSSVVIHVPDTTCGVGESSSTEVNEAEYAEDDYTRCSSPCSVISHVEEVDVCDPEVKPRGDIGAAEEKAYSPDTCYLPNGQLKDDVLVSVSDLVSYSSDDETKLKDVYRNGDSSLCTLEDEEELEKREPESVNLETKAVTAAISVPDVMEVNASNGLSLCKDDTESNDSETEAVISAVPVLDDVENNECNGEKKDLNEQTVLSPEFCDATSYRHSNIQLLDSIPVTCGDLNENDVDDPSENLKILQDQSQFIIKNTDQNELQTYVDSQPGNIISSDQSNGVFLDGTPDSHVSTEAQTGSLFDDVTAVIDQDVESKPLDIDKLEAASSISSHSVPIEEKVEHEAPVDTRSEPYLLNNERLLHLEQDEEFQGDVVSTAAESTLQRFVPVSEQISISDFPQSSSLMNLPDEVEYPLAPVFSGFGMVPQLAPINLEEGPPLPPLPPMQWRMGKLQNGPDDGQHSVSHFPPMFPQMASNPSLDQNENTENQKSEHYYQNAESSTYVLPSLHTEEDENSVISSQVNEESQSVSAAGREIIWPSSNSSLPLVDDKRPNGIRPMKIQRPRTPLIDAVAAHDKSKLRKVSERARPEMHKEEEKGTLLQLRKVSERATPQLPKEEERDALLQLRKVSERARPHIPKEEERDTLLEQIRAKSFNLKPAIQTRPSIQVGPTTNLRVAAILEKANAIRQAFAGSDDDDEDDNDSWSDS